jgi:hypothetical protein
MGRWSGFQLQTNNDTQLNILTVYRPTISQDLLTCYQQQMNSIKNNGNTNPDPRQQLLDNLSTLINKYIQSNDRTIVMIDANEGLFSNNSKYLCF